MSEDNKYKLFWVSLFCIFLLGCIISFWIGRVVFPKENSETEIKIERDTIIVKDTITIKEPIEKIRWKDKLVYIPITDTLILYQNDTTYIMMQEEKVEYEDEEYRAIVSGINPKLEEISVYPKTVYITEKETVTKKKHWNFSIIAGPGVFYNHKTNIKCGIGIMAGFGYSF